MITLRKSQDRGHAHHGWLEAKHSFSFGHYYDPKHMGFGPLRVINEDKIEAGMGFDTHGHRNMEIVTYILEGALEHKDSLGSGSVLRPGEVQRMTAGSGIRHSEFNHRQDGQTHLLQIWLLPEANELQPSYEQKDFGEERNGTLRLVASRDAREGSLKIHQDTDLFASVLDKGGTVDHVIGSDRKGWLQVAKGRVKLNDLILEQGDGAAIDGEEVLKIEALEKSDFLLFDMIR